MTRLCTTGRSRQALRDALAEMRRTGEAWVTWEGERLRLAPSELPGESESLEALVRNGRHVGVETLVGKDAGDRVRTYDGRRCSTKMVLARVLERHAVKP